MWVFVMVRSGGGFTVKALFSVTISAPVVTVILRRPVGAAGSILSTAVADAGPETVRAASVMPGPKAALVVPCTQCVYWPVSGTVRFCSPCGATVGEAESSTGVPAVTANPPLRVSTLAPVSMFTVRGPGAAEGSTLMMAVAAVEDVTVTEATVIPAPKFAVVVPCTQVVYWPTRATDRFC